MSEDRSAAEDRSSQESREDRSAAEDRSSQESREDRSAAEDRSSQESREEVPTNTGDALLRGVRIVECSMLGPAAITTALADLGADVIKVEPPRATTCAR